jgi:hypothetical protein
VDPSIASPFGASPAVPIGERTDLIASQRYGVIPVFTIRNVSFNALPKLEVMLCVIVVGENVG